MSLFKSKAPTYGLCFDFETSGTDFNKPSCIDYQGISVGLAVFETRTFNIIDELYIEIKFDETKYKWNPEVEKIHGLTREYLAENGITQEDAACQIVEFLLKYFGPNPTIMVAGHNIDFDLSFMDQLLSQFGLMFKVHNVKLDTAGAGFIALTTYKSDDVFEIFCDGKRDLHFALEDVKMTLEAMKNMRLVFEAVING